MAQDIKSGTGRICDYCKSEEGLPRLIGGYTVELTEVKTGEHTKLVCQGCRYKEKEIRSKISSKNPDQDKKVNKIKSLFGFK